MKKSRVWIALASGLVLAGFLAAELSAQQGVRSGGATRAGSDIALLDIGVIFKNNTRFKQHMADLQADMQRAEEQMKNEGKSLQALSERLKEYNAGSAEYKQLEEEITKRSADRTVRFQLQKKEFAKTEARTYHMIYQEIQQEVDAFAQHNGIAAVLKFNSETADGGENPDAVLRDLNKPVIWYARNLDITPIILESLNRRALHQGDQRSGPVNLPPRR